MLFYKLAVEFGAMKSLVSIVHEMLLLSVAAKSDNHVDILLQLIRTSGPRSDELSIRGEKFILVCRSFVAFKSRNSRSAEEPIYRILVLTEYRFRTTHMHGWREIESLAIYKVGVSDFKSYIRPFIWMLSRERNPQDFQLE